MPVDVKTLELKVLDLDPENPRLPKYVQRDQPSMFEFLARTSSIQELMLAISENGFFQAETLIGVPSKTKGRYVVVEGNRRLTALKLLSGEVYPNIPKSIVDVVDTATHKPEKVPVSIYKDRKEILSYLGNRHIAGVKAWGALAKARYVQQIYDSTDPGEDFAARCSGTAKIIGSKRGYISRTLRAYDVYQKAETKEFFGIDGLDEEAVKFSLISTAIDYEGVQQFLYGAADDDDDPLEKPADEDHIKELFSWLFVTENQNGKKRSRLGESRNLNKLSHILLSEDALKAFRKGADLDQAYLLTKGVEDDFDSHCSQAQHSLREANSLVGEIEKTDERQKLATSIAKQAAALEKVLRD